MSLSRLVSWMLSLLFLAGLLGAGDLPASPPVPDASDTGVVVGIVRSAVDSTVLPGAAVRVEGTGLGASTRQDGTYRIENVPAGSMTVTATFVGFSAQKRTVQVTSAAETTVDFYLSPSKQALDEVVVTGALPTPTALQSRARSMVGGQPQGGYRHPTERGNPPAGLGNTESYDRIEENAFRRTQEAPLSTFSIDVDGASYTNIRRFLQDGQAPPVDAVRIEEMINYFAYNDAAPEAGSDVPFAVTMEGAPAPWAPRHTLLRIGLQGREIPETERPPTNLVFLLDVSGSMQSPDKLPLLKRAFGLLVEQLRPEDRVGIVVYAGNSGVVLEPTPGDEKDAILSAIQVLRAGGSTAGEAGIRGAYRLAEEHLDVEGIHRVVLATDGDFNIGPSSDAEMIRLIEEKRESGVFLTVLGFGTGNLKDSKMEQIANHGNGSYHYVDSIHEARRVLVEELGGTLQTIAKDVKLQVEFNPQRVGAYRLIGYENRLLANEDFADDRKDAGELGAGHHVTALYELVAPEDADDLPSQGELKYQETRPTPESRSPEWATLKLRYKAPDADESRLIETTYVPDRQEASVDHRFASAVAAFGMILRDSEHKGTATLADVRALAESGRGDDPHGYRAEFIRLVEAYRAMSGDDPRASRE